MMKRTNRSPLVLCAVLFVGLALSLFPATEAHARVDRSVGQAGDPNDGEDIFGGGSGTDQEQTPNTITKEGHSSARCVLLIPTIVAGVLVFKIVTISTSLSVSR